MIRRVWALASPAIHLTGKASLERNDQTGKAVLSLLSSHLTGKAVLSLHSSDLRGC
jgi:hypothetical protein